MGSTEAVSKPVMHDEDDDDNKPLVFKKSFVKDGDQSHRKPFDINGDSEDGRPLRSIISMTQEQEINGNTTLDESDDDEAPISSRLQKKKHVSEKPKVSGKRLVEKDSYEDQSSMKKHKASSSTAKQDSMNLGEKRKAVVSPNDTDDEDDDDVPIAKRIKADSSSNNKTPPTKPKVTKQSSTASSKKLKVTRVASPPPKKRSKRSRKDSEYAQWTTLVHNGVTFPPTYQPHGTKIFYKGKPVSLSPEQEEVIIPHSLPYFFF